jgi:hypothetical protein
MGPETDNVVPIRAEQEMGPDYSLYPDDKLAAEVEDANNICAEIQARLDSAQEAFDAAKPGVDGDTRLIEQTQAKLNTIKAEMGEEDATRQALLAEQAKRTQSEVSQAA